MLAEREEFLAVDELAGVKSQVRPQSTASLVVRDRTPGASVCVPNEPVLLSPRVVDVELSCSRDESPFVPVEE